MKEHFQAYRKAWEGMEADEAVHNLRETIRLFEEALEKEEAPYRERMEEAQAAIEPQVIGIAQSVKVEGVRATYYKPRISVSWKAVAQELEPPEELIGKYTKVGKPRVSIKVEEGA